MSLLIDSNKSSSNFEPFEIFFLIPEWPESCWWEEIHRIQRNGVSKVDTRIANRIIGNVLIYALLLHVFLRNLLFKQWHFSLLSIFKKKLSASRLQCKTELSTVICALSQRSNCGVRLRWSHSRVGLNEIEKSPSRFLKKKRNSSACRFRFFLHMPGEVPAMSHKYYQVSRLEATGVLIKPTHISTSNGLRSFNPKKRQCFFNSERKLRFFKIYTQNNCEAECMANWTQISCGCVRFSMPRDNITRICGTPKINCYRKAEQRMFDEHALKNPAKEFHENCTCLPSCTSITYGSLEKKSIFWLFYWF